MRTKGQSEMVGFAVILIIVTVLVFVFLSFSAEDSESKNTQSEKIKTFLEAFSEVTTPCENGVVERYVSMKNLISMCENKRLCYNEENSCDIMEELVEEIMESSWKAGEDLPIKGYELKLFYDDGPILEKKEGIESRNREISSLTFPSDDQLFMQLTIYS